jgi:hypothetical protein
MLDQLSREDRLRLMKFVCSFAWADLEVQPEERAFVGRMIEKLGLEDDRTQVEAWLKTPPRPEEVDPTRVPRAHRELFLQAVKGVIGADNVIDENESENLELLEQLLV